jgi:hypothetical protein
MKSAGFARLLQAWPVASAADNGTMRRMFVVSAALVVVACSGPQVRTLANGAGPPAYELRGDSLAAVEAEAGKLCARGYDLLRWSQRFARPEPEDNSATQWLQQAGDWLSGLPGNQAQATVVCRG